MDIRKYLPLLVLVICLGLFVATIHVEAVSYSCPKRTACNNACDTTGNECAPDANGVLRTCPSSYQGSFCIQLDHCDNSLPGHVSIHSYQCLIYQRNPDLFHWVDLGTSYVPPDDCANFCGGPTPTEPPPDSNNCSDRPFEVSFESSRVMGPGETMHCEVHQQDRTCVPCNGLTLDSACDIGTSFKQCATARTDCKCKNGGFSYTCTLNGRAFQGGSNQIPPDVANNAQTASIHIDPPGSGFSECSLGKACNNCNGDPTHCYPDCAGGFCDTSKGTCTSCPSDPLTCTVGQSCAGKCNGKDDVCYPGCNGGLCNNGFCDTCNEAGAIAQPSPTPLQAKSAVTFGPTFTPGGVGSGPPSQTQRWVCLSATGCSDPFAECSGQGDSRHRISIRTGKAAQALSNQPTYIFDCMIGPNGPECTSGDSAVDTFALQKDMTGTNGYQFKGFLKGDGVSKETNPFLSGNLGEISRHEWEATTSTAVGHVFFAMNPINPREFMGTDPSTKQSTFLLGSPETTCTMITSDPYGRIFNGKTLEPIARATVTILKKNSEGSFIPVQRTDVLGGIENPAQTSENGSFFFRVPDGTYKLKVEAPGYSFPMKDELNKNYSVMYQNIYSGEEIVQNGQITHHDIPLNPQNTKQSIQQAKSTSPKMMSINQTLENGTFTIQGMVSHSLSTINIYGKKAFKKTFKRTRLLTNVKADKEGKFIAYIKENALGSHEVIGDVEIVKSDLFSSNIQRDNSFIQNIIPFMGSFIKKAFGKEHAPTTIFKLQPMPGRLDGYAYNDAGKILPAATVEIYLPFSNNSVAQTQTDEKGHFSIPEKFIPTIQYTLKYKTATGKLINKTPTQFLLDNST